MKLQQLRYAVEVFRRNLNISDAADALFTSQPGVSKQIKLLEEELGTSIFIRSGKRIVAVTSAGRLILDAAERILRDVQKIKHIGNEFSGSSNGTLTLGATHNHIRYRLPQTVQLFLQQYPDVNLTIRQGTAAELMNWVQNGEVDFAIASEMENPQGNVKILPCSEWQYGLLLPENHPLLQQGVLCLADLSAYPLITYDGALDKGTALNRTFAALNPVPRIALTAADSDILKTYVRLGLGIGLIDTAAYAGDETDLRLLPLQHLFAPLSIQLLIRSDTLLRQYDCDFIQLFHPPFDRARLDHLLYAPPAEDFSI